MYVTTCMCVYVCMYVCMCVYMYRSILLRFISSFWSAIDSLLLRSVIPLSIWIWVYEYMSIWVYEYMSIWVYECMSVCIYEYMSIWVYEYIRGWVLECISGWAYEYVSGEYTSIWVYEWTRIQVDGYMSTTRTCNTYTHTHTLTHTLILIPASWYYLYVFPSLFGHPSPLVLSSFPTLQQCNKCSVNYCIHSLTHSYVLTHSLTHLFITCKPGHYSFTNY